MTIREIISRFHCIRRICQKPYRSLSKQYSFGTKISLNYAIFFENTRLNIAGPMGNLFLVSPSLEELCLERLGHFPARWRAYFNGKDLFFLVLTIE